MNWNQNKSTLLILILIGALFMGCKKTGSEEPFGLEVIYIPQSTVSGGTNLNYFVPTGFDENTYNYNVDNASNKVNVFLGVKRSGKAKIEPFTVDVSTRQDTVQELITNGTLKTDSTEVVLLPDDAYSLPQQVNVGADDSSTSFNLSIDKNKLLAYAGKKVALCVVISNPSKYTVSDQNNQVIIIIDVDALQLQ